MEKLLHYVWQHRLFPADGLLTDRGEPVTVVDPGLANADAGPDFLGAKVRIGRTLWAGNVELHLRASDWRVHGHDRDAAYDNVVLHVVELPDGEAVTTAGERVPQVRLAIPEALRHNYAALLAAGGYPPCRSAIGTLDTFTVGHWLGALTVERLENKARRIENLLERTGGDWEYVFFITLARNFGFGINGETFEDWALRIAPSEIGKHRDNLFQVEAFFFGQAGLLADEAVRPEQRDDHFRALQSEYAFLARKFTLAPLDFRRWRFLRLRPQGFPHIRLSQLARLYHEGRVTLSRLLEATSPEALHSLLRTGVTGYWETHYCFGRTTTARTKTLQGASLDLIVVNTVAPLLFAYGRRRENAALVERAVDLLEQTCPERNHIVRAWADAGIKARNAAETQALVHLKRAYCERQACLRCRFGAAYLRQQATDRPASLNKDGE